MIRTYTELSKLKTFDERYDYLKLHGKVGKETFGYNRYLNQMFYKNPKWLAARDKVIVRDNGFDLGIINREIIGSITVHHMNNVTKEHILNDDPCLYDPEYLISSESDTTHKAIHYSDKNLLRKDINIRKANDTIPWKQ